MLVRVLVTVIYDETGWNWQKQVVRQPTWDQIDSSIRQLDQFCHPWIELHLTDDPDDPGNSLTVMGGKGVYWIALTADEWDQLRLFDPDKSSRKVDLWISDQGFDDHELHTTTDLELVMRIAGYFAQTGKPLPDATWEPR